MPLAAGVALLVTAGLAAGATSTDPKAVVIARLQEIVKREMNLDLTLRDVGYDVWAKKTVLDGMELRTPAGEPVAKAGRVVVVTDLFALGTGAVAVAELVRIENGDLVLDVDRAPRPDRDDKREARLNTLIVKESKLTVVKGKKPHVQILDMDVKGSSLSAGAAGWAAGTITGTAVANVPAYKIAGAKLDFGVKLGETVELRLDAAGGCGVERTFAMSELTMGKVDAAELVRAAVAPCKK